MKDRLGREIDYLRVSVTDRCNLRCRYCMPQSPCFLPEEKLLSLDGFFRLCSCAARLGIRHLKVTGGEPLVRPGLLPFLGELKKIPGIESVTLTTNGLLLEKILPDLCRLGIDGINISLDTLDESQYCQLTGGGALSIVLKSLQAAAASPIPTKINAVLMEETAGQIPALAALAEKMPVDVRFIEMMPIGLGSGMSGVSSDRALAALKSRWPDLSPVFEKRGSGPARYFGAGGLCGRIGLIDSMSHRFCESCNRVRLTCTGILKSCLSFSSGVDLSPLLKCGSDNEIMETMGRAIWEKPASHCFLQPEGKMETRTMYQIGG